MAKKKTKSRKPRKASVSEPNVDYQQAATNLSDSHKKVERISLRVSEMHKKEITEASELAGFKNVNDYIIHISLAASQQVVREHKLLTLHGRDSIAFLDALHQSQKINKTLQKAMDKFMADQNR